MKDLLGGIPAVLENLHDLGNSSFISCILDYDK